MNVALYRCVWTANNLMGGGGRKGGCSANGGRPVEASAHSGEKEEERPQARSGGKRKRKHPKERERRVLMEITLETCPDLGGHGKGIRAQSFAAYIAADTYLRK